MVDDSSQLYFGLEKEFEWDVVYSYVDEGSIFRLKDDKKLIPHPDFRKYYKPFKYNIFDEPNIYEEFASIDIDNLKSIDDFINKRGILGLHIEYGEKNLMDEIHEYENIQERAIKEDNFDIIKLQYSIRKSYNLIKEFAYNETLDDFIRELAIMKNILLLNSFDTIKVSEEHKVRNIIKKLEILIYEENKRYEDFAGFEITFPLETSKNTSSFILLQHEVKAIVSKVIERKMRNVKPKLALTFTKDKGYTYINTWEPQSLLGCMYTMIYNDLTQGNKIDICPACGNPVIIRDKRSNKYHTSCQTRKDTANTREKVSNQVSKYIQENYIDSDMPTNIILEKEKERVVKLFGGTARDVFNKSRINKWLDRK